MVYTKSDFALETNFAEGEVGLPELAYRRQINGHGERSRATFCFVPIAEKQHSRAGRGSPAIFEEIASANPVYSALREIPALSSSGVGGRPAISAPALGESVEAE